MPERDETRHDGPDEAALAIVARHALHDEELVAALAAGGLGDDEADERARARSFVDRCSACRALHDDVAAIGLSLRADAAFTISAPRDFRLRVEDAHRLGGTVITRRVAGGFRALLLGIARPVGASMAALGVVGVLVGSAVLGAAGLGGAPAIDMGSTTGGAAAPSVGPAALGTFELTNGPVEPPGASERTSEIESPPDDGRQVLAPGGAAWLLGVSVVVVVAGAALFLVGVRATRSGSPDSAAR